MTKDILILAVETICDETSVSVIKNGRDILSNTVLSQIESHKRFGGVVPEVAQIQIHLLKIIDQVFLFSKLYEHQEYLLIL